jgi:hypothetical protein
MADTIGAIGGNSTAARELTQWPAIADAWLQFAKSLEVRETHLTRRSAAPLFKYTIVRRR